MDLDLFDGNDDAAKNVRAGSKFLPRAKPRLPKRGLAAPLEPRSQQFPTTEQSYEPQNPSYPDGQRNSGSVNASSEHDASASIVDSVVDSGPDMDVLIPVPDSNENPQSCFEKSARGNSDIFIGLESLGDYIPDSASVLDNNVISSGAPASCVPGSRDAGEGLDGPLIHSVDDSDCLLHIPNIDTESQVSVAEDPLADNELIVVEPILNPQDMYSVLSGYDLVNQDSVPAFTEDNVPNFSSVGLAHTIPAESISEVLADDGQRSGAAISYSAAEILGKHMEAGPKVPGKLASRRAKTTKLKTPASDHSPDQHETSTSNQTGIGRRSLRKRQNRDKLHQLADEVEDEALVDGVLPAESPNNSAVDGGADSDSEFQLRNEPQTGKRQKKSNKPLGEIEKQVRKRKKDNEKSDETVKAAPKKFSHSTRRRRVDKSLLENSDNIDVQKVSLMNLIRLAEYKEHMAKKEAAASQVPLPNQSTSNHAARDYEDGAGNAFQEYDEGEDFAFEKAGFVDEESIPVAEESSSYFNYQTFMKRTHGARWSKQDTELFYEAVQQFGTDLSMIQQLFPGRTRRQVKLKYKKEERQHPLRLREALVNRAKGHSHFEVVIERLRQIAAEEKENDNKDDSLSLEGDEEASKAKEEEEVTAPADEENVVDKEPELPEEESPVQSHDSEDELFRWSQYKSEL